MAQKPDYFSKFKEVPSSHWDKYKPVEETTAPPVQATAPIPEVVPVQETKSVEEEEADSFLSRILGTIQGDDNSYLPAAKGITRPLLPESGKGDWEGWGDMKWLYDNFARPASHAVGLAGEIAPIGKGLKYGARGIKSIVNRVMGKADNVLPDMSKLNPNTRVTIDGQVVKDNVPNAANPVNERPLSPPVNISPKFGQANHAGAVQINVAANMPIGNRLKFRGVPTPEDLKLARMKGFQFDGEVDDAGRYIFTKVDNGIPAADLPILESEVAGARPTKANTRPKLGPDIDAKRKGKKMGDDSAVVEAFNLSRAMMASNDLSAPLRQGLSLIHKKAFWKAIPDMIRSYGSEEVFQELMEEITKRDFHKKRFVTKVNKAGEEVVEEIPSFAEEAGLKLTDLLDLSMREERIMSNWAESGIKLGKEGSRLRNATEKMAKPYAATVGRGVRAGNRAYTIFLNKLRADTFDDLVTSSNVFAGTETNLVKARALADFVNVATGRGSLNLGKIGSKEIDLEPAATVLNSIFFSPRLIASRIQLPLKLISSDKTVRMEALKSIASIAAFGNIIGGLAKFAGGEVENDPVSADFGKIKFGDTRFDPYGGYQQYVVEFNRIGRPEGAKIESIPFTGGKPFTELTPEIAPLNVLGGAIGHGGGRFKSSEDGDEYNYSDAPYGKDTKWDTTLKFGMNKLNPVFTFVIGTLHGKGMDNNPWDIPDEVAKRMTPILVQDLVELATENPKLFPGIAQILKGEDLKPMNVLQGIPSAFGMSVQKYGNYDKRGGW